MLFDEFPIDHARLWVRKLQPPLMYVTGSVGVSLERNHTLRTWACRYVRIVLQRCEGNKSKAGRILGSAAKGKGGGEVQVPEAGARPTLACADASSVKAPEFP